MLKFIFKATARMYLQEKSSVFCFGGQGFWNSTIIVPEMKKMKIYFRKIKVTPRQGTSQSKLTILNGSVFNGKIKCISHWNQGTWQCLMLPKLCFNFVLDVIGDDSHFPYAKILLVYSVWKDSIPKSVLCWQWALTQREPQELEGG